MTISRGQRSQAMEGLDCLEWELQNLSHTQGTTDFNCSTYRAFQRNDTPIHRHTMHYTEANTVTGHCHLQWAWFNKIRGMVNILETAADLTNESWAKLAKAKSRGLTCRLVMETIKSETTWDEIKDLLRLKPHNANIHTNISCFMDIQQPEKESLAAYLHQFKMESKNVYHKWHSHHQDFH